MLTSAIIVTGLLAYAVGFWTSRRYWAVRTARGIILDAQAALDKGE